MKTRQHLQGGQSFFVNCQDNRAAYPPFATFDTTLNTIPGSTLVLNPTVSYKSGTVFKQIEDFDDGSLSLVMSSGPASPMRFFNRTTSVFFFKKSTEMYASRWKKRLLRMFFKDIRLAVRFATHPLSNSMRALAISGALSIGGKGDGLFGGLVVLVIGLIRG